VGGVLSTTGFILWSYLRHEQRATAVLDDGQKAQNLCEAYRRLARPGAPEPSSREVLEQVGPAERLDQWDHPFEFQPWDHSVRSYGPDGQRGTADDVLTPCGRH
jgi:hypothetical protein